MKSFSLLRTNVGLTTNVKIICDSNYGLYLESIDSLPELSTDRYKKVRFNSNNFFDELVPFFYKNTPSDIAFSIKYDNDNSNMSTDFSKQYDDLYQMGARNISNNKDYEEEYEYFAPLYVFKHSIPKYFIIFRIDGPGLDLLTTDNFRTSFIENFKTVKLFDLTNKTQLGQWIENSIKENRAYPSSSLDIDFRNLEFTRWIGIDYNSGGFTYKSLFLEDFFEVENTLFDFEKLFFDGYQLNKIIHPHIINFSFLFDDNPATPNSLRKWSINRYSGFYIDDMELIDCITPFITPSLKKDIEILDGNILHSESGDPFVLGYQDFEKMWVEYKGEFYLVEKFTELINDRLSIDSYRNIEIKKIDSKNQKSEIIKSNGREIVKNDVIGNIEITKYRIISEIDLKGKESFLNKKTAYIDSSKRIVNIDQSQYTIDNFTDADINLIEIDGIFHNIVLRDGFITLNTDYGFNFIAQNKFEYFINSPDPNYYKSINLSISEDNIPKNFKIFRLKFTDIKDFDTQIVDNEFSKFEYEKVSDIVDTEEPKMYTTSISNSSTQTSYNDYVYKDSVVLVPASSDYTANLETFRIVNNDLTDLWRKNSVYSRFCYQNSISTGDYPYLLNNNTIHEKFNRCCDVTSFFPKRTDRNLDYFYTINSGTNSYIHHSLHIEKNIDGVQDPTFNFELDKYLNVHTYSVGTLSATYSFDYFNYLFNSSQSFLNGDIIKNVSKFSYFNSGDSDVPNNTLFKGLKFNIFEVNSIRKNNNSIENLNLFSSNKFEDYKLSILLSRNEKGIDNNNQLIDLNNTLNWQIIKNWELNTEYNTGDIIVYEDIIYSVLNDNIVENPNDNPSNLSSLYSIYSSNQPLWNPNGSYNPGDWIYRDGDYWIRKFTSGIDFWYSQSSNSQSFSIYKGRFYKKIENSNFKPVEKSRKSQISENFDKFWKEVPDPKEWFAYDNEDINSISEVSLWDKISIWSNDEYYIAGDYIVHNDILWRCIQDTDIEDEPSIFSENWEREYSFVPDSDFIYSVNNNPIIIIGNTYYMCQSNSNNSRLDSGITVYINEKWKNVLINISINDNTLENIKNSERDLLYDKSNYRLTAANFIRQINDLDSKYEFSKYTNYVIIDENGNFSKYDINNIETLPYIIICQLPDTFEIRNNSLVYNSIEITNKKIKSNRSLVNGDIDNLSKLNFYNNIPIAYNIDINLIEENFGINYNGRKNISTFDNASIVAKSNSNITETLFRYSGSYMPLFYDIQLFRSGLEYDSNIGNYKFDENLTFFGTIRQRIISKINRSKNILKLREVTDLESKYPMLDEFGYISADFFIFKSTWDFEYHVECNLLNLIEAPKDSIINNLLYTQNVIQSKQ